MSLFFVIKNYDRKLPLVTSKLTVTKLLHIYNFIKNVLHHGRPACNFAIFFEFLENLWGGSGCRAFKPCAFIVIFAVYFRFDIFQNFGNIEILLNLNADKLREKIRNKVQSSEI